MASLNELYINLQENIIDKEIDNYTLRKELKEKFIIKGLPANTPTLIFGDNLAITEVSKLELICFTSVCYEIFRTKELNPKNYFSDSELLDYETWIHPEVIPNSIILDRVVKSPKGKSFTACYIPIEYLASLMNNRLIRYNHETQREATYRKIKGNKIIKEITINKKSVNEIAQEMLEDKFPSNEITFNILMLDGKTPQLHYDEDDNKLEIIPNLDFTCSTTTTVDCVDGWHRLSACLKAVDVAKKKGIQLESTLNVKIELMTLEEAKEYIIREGKRNLITESYIEALKFNSYNDLINEMNRYGNRENNIFYKNIALTGYERNKTNKFITKGRLEKIFENNKIKVNNIIETKMLAQRLCKIATDLNNMEKTDINTMMNYAISIKDTNGINDNSDEYIEKLIEFGRNKDEVKVNG